MSLTSPDRKRRRRRRSSQPPPRPNPVAKAAEAQLKRRTTEILASAGILLAAAALIVLAWINESSSISVVRSDQRARVEAAVGGQAVVLADEIRREMLGIDQSLKILKAAFQADPDHFDLQSWHNYIPVLTDVMRDVFIADQQLVIRQDTNPTSVGEGVGANIGGYAGLTTQHADSEDGMLIASPVQSVQTREHVSFLILRLDRPGGWFVGAAFRTDTLVRMYAAANLGVQGMTALINTKQGRVLAIAGPGAANPNYEIGSSAMFAAMKEKSDGTWLGPSAPDGIQRIHGFHHVPGRDLAVVVAVDQDEAMQPAATWAEGARALAWGATIVILIGVAAALHMVWTMRSNRRLHHLLDRERTVVNGIQSDLAEARARLDSRAVQVQALSDGIEEGLLVVDANLRVTEWNQRFAMLSGIAEEQLQSDAPLDEMLRSQAREGEFGPVEDIEGEVARYIAQLRAGEVSVYQRDGRTVRTSATVLPDGGLIVVLSETDGTDEPALLAHASSEPEAPEQL